jgi:hypothetical protein
MGIGDVRGRRDIRNKLDDDQSDVTGFSERWSSRCSLLIGRSLITQSEVSGRDVAGMSAPLAAMLGRVGQHLSRG